MYKYLEELHKSYNFFSQMQGTFDEPFHHVAYRIHGLLPHHATAQ